MLNSSVEDDDERMDALEFDLGGSLNENFIGGVILGVVTVGIDWSIWWLVSKARIGVTFFGRSIDDVRLTDDFGLTVDDNTLENLLWLILLFVTVVCLELRKKKCHAQGYTLKVLEIIRETIYVGKSFSLTMTLRYTLVTGTSAVGIK